MARVSRVTGEAEHVHRLAEIGLRGGTRIEMFRPGNPCILRIRGNKVCLRMDGVVTVMVTPLEASS
jgi:Fe2+ transport system protein FeoA